METWCERHFAAGLAVWFFHFSSKISQKKRGGISPQLLPTWSSLTHSTCSKARNVQNGCLIYATTLLAQAYGSCLRCLTTDSHFFARSNTTLISGLYLKSFERSSASLM